MNNAIIVGVALLSGCTTIHAVAGGTQPGEIYVVAARSILFFPPTTYVARCVPDAATSQPACAVILMDEEFGEQTGWQLADYREWFATCSATGAAEAAAGTSKASHVDVGSVLSRAGQAGCDAGYSTAYDRSVTPPPLARPTPAFVWPN